MISTSFDDASIRDYCETTLDDIVHLHDSFTLSGSTRYLDDTDSSDSLHNGTRSRKHPETSCCLTDLFKAKKKGWKVSRQRLAPVVTLTQLISTSFSVSSSSTSSSNGKKSVTHDDDLPSSSTMTKRPFGSSSKTILFDPSSSGTSTPKSFLVHSHRSISNYRMQAHMNPYEREYSLEEQCHREECRYCSDDKAISLPFHSNVHNFDLTSLECWELLHAVKRYLSSANVSSEYFEPSAVSSDQHRAYDDNHQHLSLCEINEIIFSVYSDIDDRDQRNEILQSLATSLRQAVERTPTTSNPIVPFASLDQSLDPILDRVRTYDRVMKLCSFYLLLLVYCTHLLGR